MFKKLMGLVPMVRNARSISDMRSWHDDIMSTVTIMFVLHELTEEQADKLQDALIDARMDRGAELRAKMILNEEGKA